MDILNVKPPKIALICLLMALMLHLVFPMRIVPRLVSLLLGVFSFGTGFFLTGWAWVLFQQKETAVCPTEVPKVMVTWGPYRATRNPMYLGIVLILLGFSFLMGSLPGFVGPPAFFFVIDTIFVPHEEEILEEAFGREYLDYKKRIRRWL